MRKCVDCGKLLTGHNKAIRCKSCGNKFSYLVKNGHYATRLMKCVNCGIEFYEYDSNKTKSINGVCCL